MYTPSHENDRDEKFETLIDQTVLDILQSPLNGQFNIPGGSISIKELEKAINNLKLRKAPGFDKLQNEHLRYCGTNFRNEILNLFNACLRQGKIPNC